MTNTQKAQTLIHTFANGDTATAASLLAEGYIQHNLAYGSATPLSIRWRRWRRRRSRRR